MKFLPCLAVLSLAYAAGACAQTQDPPPPDTTPEPPPPQVPLSVMEAIQPPPPAGPSGGDAVTPPPVRLQMDPDLDSQAPPADDASEADATRRQDEPPRD